MPRLNSYQQAEKTARRTGLATRICVVAMTAAGSLLPGYAVSQNYPEKPVRFVLPSAVGGGTDTLARLIAQKLTSALGQPVVPDNRPGAGGNVGYEIVAKAAPDGYTIIMGATPMAINVTLFAGKLSYNPEKDFTPVTLVGKLPLLLSVHPSVPAKTLKEFVALAKAQPGKLSYGSAGTGSSNHLMGEMLKKAAGIDIVHVPYKSGAQGLLALLSGQIEVLISPTSTLLPMVKAGRVRAIAISSAQRSSVMPDVPTIAESGLAGFEAVAWYCIVAPAGLPRPILTRLNAEIVKILNGAEAHDAFTALGAIVETSTPEEAAAFVRSEVQRWGKIVKSSGAKAD